jgi:hypothetical protein
MRLIAHRGNIEGPNPELENSIPYISRALSMGYDVEIDLWVVDQEIYLGHDKPQYKVNIDYLISIIDKAWIHCKNFEAINFMSNNEKPFNYFWHENDSYTVTSHGFIWTYPGRSTGNRSIYLDFSKESLKLAHGAYGLCSDYFI